MASWVDLLQPCFSRHLGVPAYPRLLVALALASLNLPLNAGPEELSNAHVKVEHVMDRVAAIRKQVAALILHFDCSRIWRVGS